MTQHQASAAPVASTSASADRAKALLNARERRARDAANAQWKTLDARTIAQTLVPHMLESRPVIGKRRGAYKVDKSGRKRYRGEATPIFGAPTFRNVINENGEHV